MNTTMVKRMKKESQIEMTEKVGRFNGIESEIHYRVMTPKLKTPTSTPELVEDFRKESVMTFEIEAQADELSLQEKNFLKQVESEFNLRSPLSLEKKEESQPAVAALPIASNKVKKETKSVTIAKRNVKSKSKNLTMSDITKKEIKVKAHRKLVFNKEKVSLMDGAKEVTSSTNINKLKSGEITQGNEIILISKDKQYGGEVTSIYWNNKAKQFLVNMSQGDGKISKIRLNKILDYKTV